MTRQDPRAKRLALDLKLFDEDDPFPIRGRQTCVVGRCYLGPADTETAPYLDLGGVGLAVIDVETEALHFRLGWWRPFILTERYLIGRNEIGTAFAHAVPARAETSTITGVLRWIWSGYDPIRRQGDVAVVRAAGPKMPVQLPRQHHVDAAAGVVRHATHPDLALPGPGERLIIGKRTTLGTSSHD